ncbi:MAG: anthranilate synthase component I [Alphaproteobacteria bacterium GM202ARS2]|nr:anthranilate synthase component I [Alphaproteobacteria bacterium GM202ARS2]
MVRDVRPPTYESFSRGWDEGHSQVVWRRLYADTLTPVSALLRLGTDCPWTFLLESVGRGGTERGRYSAIGMAPDKVWRCRGNRAEIRAGTPEHPFVAEEKGALESLRAFIDDAQMALPTGLPPMLAGVFGYLGYDCVHLMDRIRTETTTASKDNRLGLYDGIFMRPTMMVIFDWVAGVVLVAYTCWQRRDTATKISAQQAWEQAEKHLDELMARLRKKEQDHAALKAWQPLERDDLFAHVASNMSRDDYASRVRQAKKYIVDGDIFQVVLSQRFSVDYEGSAFACYRALRRLNPSPFLFYFFFDDWAAVGASPELLVRLREGVVTIRPIAGTRPRGDSPEADRSLRDELLRDPKECAEHLMLLDLGRNDVGRVARKGSVRVTEKMIVENYSHVMHIVSNVEGVCGDHQGALDALIAGFPAGTLSGAPKLRAIEIIDQLEPCARGLYAGAVGYFSCTGDLDSCIALRTAVIKDKTLYVQAGGGIVADSDADTEYEETRNKARALLQAAYEASFFES